MKQILTRSFCSFLVLLAAASPGATTRYWDSNGSEDGAGTALDGQWSGTGGSAYWNTTADGTGTPAATFSNGDTAVFCAGSDASGGFTVTLGLNRTVNAILVEEGNPTITDRTLTLNGDHAISVAGGTTFIQSLLAGVDGYTVTGPGTLRLNNLANTISGPVLVNGGGTLRLTSSGRVGATTAGAGDITLDDGTLRDDETVTSGGTFMTANRNIIIGPGGGTFNCYNSDTILIYSGIVSGTGNTLTKAGAGEFRALQGWTFSKLVVSAGLYRINGSGGGETGFGAVPDSYDASAMLIKNGAAVGTSAGINTPANRGITIGTAAGHVATIVLNAGWTINSIITGPGSLVLNGNGFGGSSGSTLTLNGANDYQGTTTINYGTLNAKKAGTLPGDVNVAGGTLRLSNPSAMSTSASLTLADSPEPGAVDLNFTGTQVVSALYFGATQMDPGTYGAVGSGAAHEDPAFTGSGILRVGNNAPVAPAAKSQSTMKDTASTFANVKLLQGATDLDGDSLTIGEVIASSEQGGTVVLQADDVLYTPPAGYTGPDSYTYTISDGFGGTALGTVNVTVTAGGGTSPNIVSPPRYDAESGMFRVTFAGIPDYEYTVEYADSPTGPWSFLKIATAGSTGLFEVTDAPVHPPSQRY